MVFGGTFASPVGRFAWTQNLVTPKDPPPPQPGQAAGQARYEITLLIPKEGKATEDFIAAIKKDTDGAIELFNQGRSATIGNCLLFGKYGDGDKYDLEKYPYYKGCWVITARNAEKIADKDVMDAKKAPFDRAALKGGMKGRLVIQTIITGHGISFKMQAIQMTLDDGVRFGGASRDHGDMLDDIESDTQAPEVENKVPATEVAAPVAEVKAAPEAEKPKPAKTNKGKDAAVNLLA